MVGEATLSKSAMEYAFVRAIIDELPDQIEDNVAAPLVERLPMPISVMGLTGEGRALLDVLYEAIITGDVTEHQRKQADKIMTYRKGRGLRGRIGDGHETSDDLPHPQHRRHPAGYGHLSG